jgi:hypothetical protein
MDIIKAETCCTNWQLITETWVLKDSLFPRNKAAGRGLNHPIQYWIMHST